MKKAAVNIMATTGMTMIILALIATLYGAKFLCITSVFQSLAANIVIHAGLFLTHKFESNYIFVEMLLDISYCIGMLLVFGLIFDWYVNVPVGVLASMAVIIYLLDCSVGIFRAREEVKVINKLLQNRNCRNTK